MRKILLLSKRAGRPLGTNTERLDLQYCLRKKICKRLNVLVFSDKDDIREASSHNPYTSNKICGT